MEVIVDRVAGLDVHKKQVTACVRAPGATGARTEQVRQFPTFTEGLRQLRDWLVTARVTVVAMEATGVYWKPSTGPWRTSSSCCWSTPVTSSRPPGARRTRSTPPGSLSWPSAAC
jgi:hypothetical protein